MKRRGRRSTEPLVLCYHAVSDSWPAPLSITTARLREQLELLVRRGYESQTFSAAVTSSSYARTVAITFDDAFSSVLKLAYPILSSLGLLATVFVVTDFADSNEPLEWPGIDTWRHGTHASELRGLSWAELRELRDAGWEIGSHTRTHPRLTTLGDGELEEELRGSREACERALDAPCRSLAYPYGDVDARVATAAAAAGYEAAATLPYGLTRPTPLLWPRIGVYSKDSQRRFALKVSPTFCSARRLLAPIEELVRA